MSKSVVVFALALCLFVRPRVSRACAGTTSQLHCQNFRCRLNGSVAVERFTILFKLRRPAALRIYKAIPRFPDGRIAFAAYLQQFLSENLDFPTMVIDH